MLIDYIYLILIIVLISSIVFLLLLSYKYRLTEGFDIQRLHSLSPLSESVLNNIKNNANTNYNANNAFITGINNQKYTNDNNINLDTLDSSLNNVKNIKNLYTQLRNSKPISVSYPVNKLIKTIKSKYNSQYISTFSNDIGKYGILVNDKCITVNGLCKDEFCLLDCQKSLYSSDSQKFTSNRIYSAIDAAKIMNVDKNKIVSDTISSSIYPYNILRSTVNNNCLTNNDNGITIEKCNLNNIKQRWEISPDENICVLT